MVTVAARTAMKAIRALGVTALGAAVALSGCKKTSTEAKPDMVQIRTLDVLSLANQDLCADGQINPNLRMDYQVTTEAGKISLALASARYILLHSPDKKNVSAEALAQHLGSAPITSAMTEEEQEQTEALCLEFNAVNRVDSFNPPYYLTYGSWSKLTGAKAAAEQPAVKSSAPQYFKGVTIGATNTPATEKIVLEGDFTAAPYHRGEFKVKLNNETGLTVTIKPVRYVPADKPEPMNGSTIKNATIFEYTATAQKLAQPLHRNGTVVYLEKDAQGKTSETKLSDELAQLITIMIASGSAKPESVQQPAPQPIYAPAPRPTAAPAPAQPQSAGSPCAGKKGMMLSACKQRLGIE